MTSWVERLRQKKSLYGRNGSDKSAESQELIIQKNFVDGRSTSDKSAESSASVTYGTKTSTVSEVFSTPPPIAEVIIVAYQRFSWDYDVADGTYTPKQLRQAKKLVKPGPVLRYRLRWPGGLTEPSTRAPTDEHGAQQARHATRL
jgi:hypothetical protein